MKGIFKTTPRILGAVSLGVSMGLSSASSLAQMDYELIFNSYGYFQTLNDSSLQYWMEQKCSRDVDVCYIREQVQDESFIGYVLGYATLPQPPAFDCSDSGNSDVCENETNQCDTGGSPDPILFANGKKYLNEVDLPGNMGFTRRYDFNPSPTNITEDYRDLWRLGGKNRNVDLAPIFRAYPSGVRNVVNSKATISVILPKHFVRVNNGADATYAELDNQDNVLFRDPQANYLITKLSALEAESLGLRYGGYTMTYRNGDITYFDLRGHIMRNTRTDGSFENYSYDTDLGTGLTDETITNEKDQSVSFRHIDEYNMVFTDLNGKEYRYHFDDPSVSNPRLRVTFPDDTADPSDNPYREYEHISAYDAEGNPTILNGALKAIYDNGELYLSYKYDPDTGRAIHSHKGDRVESHDIAYTVGGNGFVATATHTNSLGKETVYHYNNIDGKQVLSRVDGEASSQCIATNSHYTHDAKGYRQTRTDERGFVSETLRDDNGNITSRRTALTWSSGVGSTLVESPESQRILTTWLSDRDLMQNRTFAEKNSEGEWEIYRIENYQWNEQNRLVQRSESAAKVENKTRTWQYTYTYHDEDQHQVATTTINGPRTDVADQTRLSYNTLGHLIEVRNVLGHTVTYSDHTASGKPQRITDANGVHTDITYDARDRILSSTLVHPSGNSGLNLVTTFRYNRNGDIERVTQVDGNYTDYSYDNAKRLTQISNAQGESISLTRDSAGNITAESFRNASQQTVYHQSRVFDELSRLKQLLQNHGQSNTFTYDEAGNSVAEEDGREFTHSNEYDGLNRLVQSMDPLMNPTQIQYNADSRITQVTDARGLTTTYTYNGLGELTQLNSPDTGIKDFSYDSAGNLISEADNRGVIAIYQYDALNRLLSVEYPSAPEENRSYTYDNSSSTNFGLGRLTSIRDHSGEMHFRFNHLGLLEQKDYAIVDQSFSTRYGYDNFGRLASITYPSGRIVHYGRDSLGRISSISTQSHEGASIEPVLDAVSYLPFGPATHIQYANGVTKSLSYDNDYRLDTRVVSGNQVIENTSLSYDGNNNISALNNMLTTGQSQSFNYDENNRVNTANGLYGELAFQYDSVGNRTQKSITLDSQTTIKDYQYQNDSQRLQAINDNQGNQRSFVYDDVGNLVQDNGQDAKSWIYNDANRPQFGTSNGQTAEYRHNSLGQRTYKSVNGQTHYFHYDEAGQLIAVSNSSGLVLKEFIHLGSQSIAVLADDAPESNLVISIQSPSANAQYIAGQAVQLSATAQRDGQDISASIQWHSSLEGPLGTGGTLSNITHLRMGHHVISASIPQSGSASRLIHIQDNFEAPVITMVSPLIDPAYAIAGIPRTLSASAIDSVDGDISSRLQWHSDIDGDLGQQGSINTTLSLGMHTITATVSDFSGAASTHSFTLVAVDNSDSDNDGLPDDWEVQYLGVLAYGASNDIDGDGLTNAQEYQFGLNPNENDLHRDTDNDQLPDAWELRYFGNLTSQSAEQDDDLDGFNNAWEYAHNTNPLMDDFVNKLDAAQTGSDIVLSNNNTTAYHANDVWRTTIAEGPLMPGKKYYWEVELNTTRALIGIAADAPLESYIGDSELNYGWSDNNGTWYHNGTWALDTDPFSPGDRIMLAFDADSGKLWYGINGSWVLGGNPVTGTNPQFDNISGLQYPGLSVRQGRATIIFAEAEFQYPKPEGFEASRYVDIDNDGLNDLWEYTHFDDITTYGGDDDPDNDGFTNAVEYTMGSDPTVGGTDSDQDGLPDIWEYEHFQSLRQTPEQDDDQDGFNNAWEYEHGTNPSVEDFTNQLNTAQTGSGIVLSNDNTTAYYANDVWRTTIAEGPLTPGKKYYWEVELNTSRALVGIAADAPVESYIGNSELNYGWSDNNGVVYHNRTQALNLSNFYVGDRLMVAYDPDSGKLWYGRNGTWEHSGNPTTGVNAQFSDVIGLQYPALSVRTGQATIYFTVKDFQYPIPEGFEAPRYADADSDQLNDVWEYTHFDDISDYNGNGDPDNDGLTNYVEYMLGTDPNVRETDSDQDGLPDIWEYEHFQSLRQTAEQNGDLDGFNNAWEYAHGTNPGLDDFVNQLNTEQTGSGIELSNGNTTAYYANDTWRTTIAEGPLTPGKKYYWEVELNTSRALIGIAADAPVESYIGNSELNYGWSDNNGVIYHNRTQAVKISNFYVGDRLMVAYDPDSGKLWYGRNGTWEQSGNPVTGVNAQFSDVTGLQYPALSVRKGQATIYFAAKDFQYAIPEGFETPRYADTDSDSLNDVWEYEHFDSLSATTGDDPDNDGFTNQQEYLAGTNPTDATSTPEAQ